MSMDAVLYWGFMIEGADDLASTFFQDHEDGKLGGLEETDLWSDPHFAYLLKGKPVPWPECDKVIEATGCKILVGGDLRDDPDPSHHLVITESEWSFDCNTHDLNADGRDTLPEMKPEWEAKLRAFCKQTGVPWQTPRWRMLVSMG